MRFGYAPTFDLGFAAGVGGAAGAVGSLVTGALLRGCTRVRRAQAAGFGAAGVVGAAVAYYSHVLTAAPLAIATYLLFLSLIAQRETRVEAESRCARCGYDLRGLPEARCPECGRPFEPEEPIRPSGSEA